jgi:assimilatory nitrate reductase catalytic subunit
VLRKLYPEDCYVEINPGDARKLGIRRNSMVTISSRRAAIRAMAYVTPTVQEGQLFIPMHYPEVNRLTFPAFDPYSRQPSYKACAVKIEIPSERQS